MLYYFDTSALVKRYAPEAGTKWVKSIVEPSTGNIIYLSQIGIVEVASALNLKKRTGELSQADCKSALQLFLIDVRNGQYIISPLANRVVNLAVDLTVRQPLKAYDAVHLAAAITINVSLLGTKSPPIIFVSADKRLCKASESEGLSTQNPTNIAKI